MVYPYYSENNTIRQKLIKEKIYTPKYWNNVLDRVSKDSIEYNFTENVIYLPIDQRYNEDDMLRIFKAIKKYE